MLAEWLATRCSDAKFGILANTGQNLPRYWVEPGHHQLTMNKKIMKHHIDIANRIASMLPYMDAKFGIPVDTGENLARYRQPPGHPHDQR